jgi:hypothetical protein
MIESKRRAFLLVAAFVLIVVILSALLIRRRACQMSFAILKESYFLSTRSEGVGVELITQIEPGETEGAWLSRAARAFRLDGPFFRATSP